MVKTFAFKGNTSVEKALSASLEKAGFTPASTSCDADAVFVFCDTQVELEDLYFDTDGLIQASRKGCYLVNLCASTPSFSRELNAVASISELYTIEAPLVVNDITLPDAFSHADNLTSLIAGEKDAVEAVKPLLLAIADTLEYIGTAGMAQLARAAITVQIASQLVACMEADALFRFASGNSSPVMSFAYDKGWVNEQTMHLLNAVQLEQFDGDYTITICIAELTAALMTADDMELILPGAEACMHLLELLAVIGGLQMSAAALSLVYGDEAHCAAQGLDWTKAEQTYAEDLELEFDDDGEESRGEFPGGFGGYSSN